MDRIVTRVPHRTTLTILLLLACLLACLLFPWLHVQADDDSSESIFSAVVAFVSEETTSELFGTPQVHQKLEIIVKSGALTGTTLEVEYEQPVIEGDQPLRAGDRIFVTVSQGPDGAPQYYVVGRDRSAYLLWVALFFVLVVVLVGRSRGVRALLGMVLSLAVILVFVLPRLAAGQDPVLVAIAGSAIALPPTYLLAHGLNRKTGVALLGSLIALAGTGLLAVLSVRFTHLSGMASEEANFLQGLTDQPIDLRALLLGGIIIGVLGVLDDITVAQAALVQQLRAANAALDWRQLYVRAMAVGQDHIASMVNTLVLVYAGAALPLLLLLTDRQLPILYVLSHEVLAEEIVRVLVTSSGLVLAVPITTLLAALAMGWLPAMADEKHAEPSVPEEQQQ
ncbi:MAG: YibE/F family protein [Anaerolineae bacterium]